MHDKRPKGSIGSLRLPRTGVLLSRPGAARAVGHFAPLTVLISGQLQVPAWRLPVSVPFANFSSQDRHEMQGAPAAVHPNPVLSMSLSNVWGDDQPGSGFGLVPPHRKRSHMVQWNRRLWLVCFWSTHGDIFIYLFFREVVKSEVCVTQWIGCLEADRTAREGTATLQLQKLQKSIFFSVWRPADSMGGNDRSRHVS